MTDAAIVIQTFTKLDTLRDLCESLLGCDQRNQFDLIFWNDSATGSRKEAEYRAKVDEVKKLLHAFRITHADQFHSVEIRSNIVNRGTCKTCQIALDSVFGSHEFVIFSEDDTIFSSDALNWFNKMRLSPAFADDEVWAIAGESIFFDAHAQAPDENFLRDAKSYAITNRLSEQYISFGFVPSTCFASTRQKWSQFSATRGQPNGDVDVCDRCKAEGRRCLFPVVARVKDVGMLHPDGYSVLIHSRANVSAVKNCYLMSDDVRPALRAQPELRWFDGNAGRLYSQSTLLNGFDEAEADTSGPKSSNIRSSLSRLPAARKSTAASEWAKALQLWREVKEGGLQSSEVDTNIGLCLFKLGKQDDARVALRQVLVAQPDEAFALSIMAYILEVDKEFSAASNIWSRLSRRGDLPAWLHASAVKGNDRCNSYTKDRCCPN